MDKLSAIAVDIMTGANATYSFWKHVFQLLLEVLTFGYLQFELERERISEESLKNINGRYLKLKVKQHPASIIEETPPKSLIALTPVGENLIAGDSQMDIDDFGDSSEEFLKQIEQLNEMWYVFAILAFLFAIGAFFIQRSLLNSQSIKADFGSSSY